MTLIKVINGVQETTCVEGNTLLYKRIKVRDSAIQVEQPVVLDRQVVELPPKSWYGPRVEHEVVYVDFGHQPEEPKKVSFIKRLIAVLFI